MKTILSNRIHRTLLVILIGVGVVYLIANLVSAMVYAAIATTYLMILAWKDNDGE